MILCRYLYTFAGIRIRNTTNANLLPISLSLTIYKYNIYFIKITISKYPFASKKKNHSLTFENQYSPFALNIPEHFFFFHLTCRGYFRIDLPE